MKLGESDLIKQKSFNSEICTQNLSFPFKYIYKYTCQSKAVAFYIYKHGNINIHTYTMLLAGNYAKLFEVKRITLLNHHKTPCHRLYDLSHFTNKSPNFLYYLCSPFLLIYFSKFISFCSLSHHIP